MEQLTTADRSVTSLASFKNRVRKRDLTSLSDDGCRGCAPGAHCQFLIDFFNSYFIVFSYMYI